MLKGIQIMLPNGVQNVTNVAYSGNIEQKQGIQYV